MLENGTKIQNMAKVLIRGQTGIIIQEVSLITKSKDLVFVFVLMV